MAPLSADGWSVHDDPKRCMVVQRVPNWGQISVEASVRGSLTWLFSPIHSSKQQRPVVLETTTPPWQHPRQTDATRYAVSTRNGHYVVEGSSANQLMRAVDHGRMAILSYRAGGPIESVAAVPAGLKKVSAAFQKCMQALPADLPEPPSIAAARRKAEDAEQSEAETLVEKRGPVLKPWVAKDRREILFAEGVTELDAAQEQQVFDMVADYLMAPPSATLVIISPNDEDARLRRESIAKYLTEQGMDPDMMGLRLDPTQSGVALHIDR